MQATGLRCGQLGRSLTFVVEMTWLLHVSADNEVHPVPRADHIIVLTAKDRCLYESVQIRNGYWLGHETQVLGSQDHSGERE
jgi:hypothetical protein